MRRLMAPIFALTILTLAGCKSRHDQVYGVWQNRLEQPFNFNKNQTYVQTYPPAQGTWAFTDDKVIIHVTSVNGMSIDDYMRDMLRRAKKSTDDKDAQAYIDYGHQVFDKFSYDLSSDGNTMTPTDPARNDSGPLVKKYETPPE